MDDCGPSNSFKFFIGHVIAWFHFEYLVLDSSIPLLVLNHSVIGAVQRYLANWPHDQIIFSTSSPLRLIIAGVAGVTLDDLQNKLKRQRKRSGLTVNGGERWLRRMIESSVGSLHFADNNPNPIAEMGDVNIMGRDDYIGIRLSDDIQMISPTVVKRGKDLARLLTINNDILWQIGHIFIQPHSRLRSSTHHKEEGQDSEMGKWIAFECTVNDHLRAAVEVIAADDEGKQTGDNERPITH
ncbi:hypothetical protein BYT27DRAFT_7206360 [Phlegmacium glaucopus]|nr:hypothetical protein BYT27DRAFT_7206360 [Phlegmacium glaucopus]